VIRYGAALIATCHQSIKKDSPAIQKLVRVYKESDFVFFSHRSHLGAGAKCEDCHGQSHSEIACSAKPICRWRDV
jgi:hypothetical protein